MIEMSSQYQAWLADNDLRPVAGLAIDLQAVSKRLPRHKTLTPAQKKVRRRANVAMGIVVGGALASAVGPEAARQRVAGRQARYIVGQERNYEEAGIANGSGPGMGRRIADIKHTQSSVERMASSPRSKIPGPMGRALSRDMARMDYRTVKLADRKIARLRARQDKAATKTDVKVSRKDMRWLGKH